MLYPDIVKQGQKINVTFSDLKSIQNGDHQSADFKLEQNVKSLKRITPKVNVSSETWQKLQRENKVESIVDHAMNLLSFVDYEICRNVNIDKEIIKWWALLHYFRYLKSTSNSLVGVYGDCLKDNLLNITETLNKMKVIF